MSRKKGKRRNADSVPHDKVIGLAKAIAIKLEASGLKQEAIHSRLDAVRANPVTYLDDPMMSGLAQAWLLQQASKPAEREALRERPLDYTVWGQDQIDPAALAQMENALRLPVATAGALMPDAHVGYGL